MTTVGAYSKENAVMIVGVIALYAWAWPKRRRWSDVLFGFLATGIPIAVMLVQRTSVLAGSLPAEFAYTDNPIAEATFWTGHLTALKVLGTYLAQAVWPWRLSIDYSYAQIPLGIKSAEDWISLALSLLAAVAMAGLWNRNRTAFFFVAFALMVFLPTSNLVFPIGTIRADRFLYLPSVGLLGCLVMAVYAFGFRVKLPQVAPAFLLVLTAAFALRTWARNAEWRDELTLARADVQTSPNSFKLHQMIARSMFATESSRPDIGLVVDEIDKSLAVLDPLPEARNNPEAYDIAGFAYLTEGDRLRAAATGDAESAYRRSRELLEKCIRINKAYERQRQAKYGKAVTVGAARTEPAAHLLLSIVDQRLGDLNAATQEANVAQRMAPQDPRMYKRIADLLLTREQGEEAAVALMKGMLITSDPELRSDLVRLYASSTDPANCTLLPGANSPAINLRCPLVLDHICAAAPDVLTTLITMGRREEAELQKQRFTTEYQCNPTPLNAALPSKQR
jgi:tetratricopeptide (TPR) repeat protein